MGGPITLLEASPALSINRFRGAIMPTGCVYLATNTVNDRAYIGKTINGLSDRIKTHSRYARNKNGPGFPAAIRKYGIEAFTWAELFSSDDDHALMAAEARLIAEYRSRGVRLYNITDGGNGVAGRKPTAKQIAAFHLPCSDEHKDALRRSWTPERRAAQAEKMRNRVIGPATRAALRRANLGKRHSAETKEKISAAKMGNQCGRKAWPKP